MLLCLCSFVKTCSISNYPIELNEFRVPFFYYDTDCRHYTCFTRSEKLQFGSFFKNCFLFSETKKTDRTQKTLILENKNSCQRTLKWCSLCFQKLFSKTGTKHLLNLIYLHPHHPMVQGSWTTEERCKLPINTKTVVGSTLITKRNRKPAAQISIAMQNVAAYQDRCFIRTNGKRKMNRHYKTPHLLMI